MRVLTTLCVLGMLLTAAGCGSSDKSTTKTVERSVLRAPGGGHARIHHDVQLSHLPPQQKKKLLELFAKAKGRCTRKQVHQLEQAAEPSKPGVRVSVDCAKRFP